MNKPLNEERGRERGDCSYRQKKEEPRRSWRSENWSWRGRAALKKQLQLPWLRTCTAKETHRDVSVGEFLSPTQKSEAKAIIQEFRDIFTDVPGMTRLGSDSIKLTTSQPIFCKPYPLPFALRDTLRRDIEQMK